MSIFGIAKKGFGKAVKAYKQKKIASGKATRSERIKYGERSPDIKKVSVSRDVKKGDVTESVRKGKQHFYIKNIDEVNKHVTDIKKGKKAEEKLAHMRETKRAFKIGKTKTFPHDPAQGTHAKESKRHN
jgi:hypothetical protein